MSLIRRARCVLADRLETMRPEDAESWAARSELLDECEAFLQSVASIQSHDD